jgi:membrane associated rhomboid family serine protease
MTDEPRLRLAEGKRLLDSGELDAATRILAPLTGHPDADLAGEAWLAIGQARYRADDEPGALVAWQNAAATGGRVAWQGWRAVAEQQVRDGNLDEAIAAYREADRRAPAAERGAIANRIAWLLKETGHDFAARRHFNRARGPYAGYAPYVTWAIIAINVLVFVADGLMGGFNLGLFGGGGGGGGPISAGACGAGSPILSGGVICADGVAAGEWWRIFTSAFLHLGLLHIAFNMYALYLFGPILEQMYGHVEYFILYMLCAAGGSVLTILAAPDQAAAGASGAIFGLFGLAFVVSRRHHVATTRQARAILSQAGTLLVLNLVFTFAIPGISWTGHVGGLLVGVMLGFLLPPQQVETISTMWRGPGGERLRGQMPLALRASIYLFAIALLAIGTYVAVLRVPSFG